MDFFEMTSMTLLLKSLAYLTSALLSLKVSVMNVTYGFLHSVIQFVVIRTSLDVSRFDLYFCFHLIRHVTAVKRSLHKATVHWTFSL